MTEYTTPEAAALLGVQPNTVTHYIKRGLLKAKKRGRDYWIEQTEVERYQAERRTAGRPRTNAAHTPQGREDTTR